MKTEQRHKDQGNKHLESFSLADFGIHLAYKLFVPQRLKVP